MNTHRYFSRAPLWLTGIAAAVIIVAGAAYLTRGDSANAVEQGDEGGLAAYMRELYEQASPEQRPLLADGTVTQEEYVSAANATHACLTSQGVVATDPEWRGGQITYTFGSTATHEELNEVNAKYQACYLTYQREIDRAWAHVNADSMPKQKTTAELQACYEQQGVKFDKPAKDFHDIMNVIDAQGMQRVHGACLEGSTIDFSE